jgi:hypothetical protein
VREKVKTTPKAMHMSFVLKKMHLRPPTLLIAPPQMQKIASILGRVCMEFYNPKLHFSSDDMFSLAGNGKHYKARKRLRQNTYGILGSKITIHFGTYLLKCLKN